MSASDHRSPRLLRRRLARTSWIAGISCALSLDAVSARASDADATTAQALFDQAKKLMSQGAYAEACPKLEESQRLDAGSGTLLNLGDCYEHQGKSASAWSKFVEAAETARAAGKAERERVARERAAALLPRLCNLVIAVRSSETTVGLEVKRDGALVDKGQWGAAVPVDPGTHTVSASAPARTSWETKVLVQGAGQTVTVAVPALAVRSSAPPPAPTVEIGAKTEVRPPPVVTAPSTSKPSSTGLGTQRLLALVSGGIGVAGLAIGTGFGLESKAKRDDAAAYCDGPICRDPAGVDFKREAIAAGNVSTIAFALGAAGVVGGVALWLSAPSPSNGATTLQVGVDTRGVIVRGAW